MSEIKCGNLYKTMIFKLFKKRSVPMCGTWWKTSLLDDANSEYRLTE